MEKLLDIKEKIANYLEISLMLGIIAFVGAQIISRSMFNKPLAFPEEVAMFMTIAFVFIGISIVERYNSHLNVSFLLDKMPFKVQKIMMFFGKGLTLVMVIVIIMGEKELLPRISALKTTAAGIPYIWLHSTIIICSVIWCLTIIYGMYQLIMGKEV